MLGPLPLLEKVTTTGESIMYDRYGCTTLPDLRKLDVSRRNFLKATGRTTLTMAAGPGLLSPAHAADTPIKGTHGTGFCFRRVHAEIASGTLDA
jgi:hypothetical protein